jgi:YVTN family beta-propeller protein
MRGRCTRRAMTFAAIAGVSLCAAATASATSITVGTNPSGVAVTPGGADVYVTNYSSGTVSEIATASNTVVGSPITVGTQPRGVAVTPNGSDVYVANQGAGTVNEIATSNNAVVGSAITVGSGPYGVAVTPSGADVYVTNFGAGTVSEIATSNNAVVGSAITVGSNPAGVAVTPSGADVYVANSGAGTVSEIATATNTVITTITVGTDPYGVAVTPNGADVYVANSGSNTVSEIATVTNTVINTITAGNGAFWVAITANGADVDVSNFGAGTVSEIPTATNTVVGTITVGTNPQGVAVTPNGAALYVANYATGTVSEVGDLPQAAPTTGSAKFGSGYSGQLAVNNGSGPVTYVTTGTSPQVSVNAAGVITALASTPAGTYTVSGTDSDTGADSGPWAFTLTVTRAGTTASLSSSGSPSTLGGQVTYAATIAPAPDGGTVSFSDGLATISGCSAQPITAGVATCVVSYPDAGSPSITAVYAGDNNYLGSSAAAMTQTVAASATTTTLASSGSPSTLGGQVTYTATIAPAPDGGTVSFSDGHTMIAGCTAQPITSGVATCAVSYLDAGSPSITAAYAGDSNYLGSTSGAVTQTIRSGALTLARQIRTVTARGALKVKVTCRDSLCTGRLKLTARVTKTTGKGTHKRRKATTITIATVSLSRLTVRAHTVSVKLTKTGLRMLAHNHDTLHAIATATYRSGSSTKRTHTSLTLKGTQPKPKIATRI